jgi:hypothetical protein
MTSTQRLAQAVHLVRVHRDDRQGQPGVGPLIEDPHHLGADPHLGVVAQCSAGTPALSPAS